MSQNQLISQHHANEDFKWYLQELNVYYAAARILLKMEHNQMAHNAYYAETAASHFSMSTQAMERKWKQNS